jgi:hypothetical protein
MNKRNPEDARISAGMRLPSRPVRLSKQELAASRAGMLDCFPSPDLYEPEGSPTRERFVPLRTKRHGVMHAKRGA